MGNVKDIFTEQAINELGEKIKSIQADFPTDKFVSAVFNGEWEQLELFARTTHIAKILGGLFSDYIKSLNIITTIIPDCNMAQGMVFSQYVAENGLDYLTESTMAFEKITEHFTCEFAVRPFIDKYPEKMLEILLNWTKSDNEHIRRLASEGTRYAIPWGARLQTIKNKPDYAISILENLKNDPAEYVRKSVANNLNELAKIAPDIVIDLVRRWIGSNKNTDWIVKHACRTLLKKAEPSVMELFGLSTPVGVSVNLIFASSEVKLNDNLVFSFEINNETDDSVKLRIGYDIGFLKSNGKINHKENKISERTCKPGITKIERKHKITETSSRKIYMGRHELKIKLNGCVLSEAEFIVCL
ncbi:MAG: DNA alkylation repair protein [Oscillospiraceae bacterium]|jgi:3-methyladenine DNA glycosylase AlkC|nr:DNA alkylation repair protein [Oscillospiraceae bacterium]